MDRQGISFILGKRLKSLREEHGLSHEKLINLLNEKYGISISRDSVMAYEISDETRSKSCKLPNLGMRVEYLYCLADFYGVSIDYLFGNTDIPTSDIKKREICEYTGLSLSTITALSVYSEKPTVVSSFISRFFEDIIVCGDIEYACKLLINSAHAGAINEKKFRELPIEGEIALDNIIDSMNGTHDGKFMISAIEAEGFYLTQAQDLLKCNINRILELMHDELLEQYVSGEFISQTPQKRIWRMIDENED